MSETRRQPSDEEIAAFAAGELRGAERSRIIKQLNRDPESYQLLLESIDLLEQSGLQDEESEEDEVTPFAVDPRLFSASRWRVAALAASAIIAVGLGVLIYTFLPQPDGPGQSAAQLSSYLVSQVPAVELNQQTWSEEPTHSFTGLRVSVASFRVGRLLVDLEIARRADALPRGRSLLADIEDLLTAQQAGPIALQEASEARNRVDAQQSLAGLENFPEQITNLLPSRWDSFLLSFGQWAEAARLASLNQQQGFFQQQDFQDFAKQVQRRNDLSQEAQNAWQEIQALLDKPRRNLDDWNELAQKWGDLIQFY